MVRNARWMVLAGVVAGTCLVGTTASAYVYWTEAGEDAINRSDLDGTDTTTLVSFEMVRCGYLAVDPAAQKMYWADSNQGKIYRADLDGTDPELLVVTPQPQGIALHVPSGKMYWTSTSANRLSRANLDGTGVESLLSDASQPFGIAVDATAGRIYWTDAAADAIVSADLNGAVVDTVISGLDNPVGIAVHEANGWIFWTESGSEHVSRVDVDGKNYMVLAQMFSMFNLRGIAVDPVRDLLFVTTDFILGHMYRMNLDGTDRVRVIEFENYGPVGVACDPTSGFFYWWHDNDRVMYRTDPVVGGMEIVIAGMITPGDLALDPGIGRVFWADGKHVFGVNADGTDFRRLVSGFPGTAVGVAVAPTAGKLYWITQATAYRANYDGTNVENLGPACALSGPAALVVDEAAGKMYWTRTSGILQRSNLDGSSCEDFPIPGLSNPTALALHGGFLYIGDDGIDELLRYELGTGKLETLVPNTPTILGIAVEVDGQKIYWSEGFNLVRRANLADGSGAETILMGRNAPWGVQADPTSTPVRTTSWGRLKGRF